ncbi:uncharacterized protein LOC143531913 [Bidens hawaiensis]|uniref:uncharacterized protein LOC143531913 n=1 Tax=Bidens hawaiensis TaxID=980011 RepID=UPI00404A7B16
MEEEGSTVRLVRCPKCENLLPELPEYSVYQCGGCGAVLRGKQSTPSKEKRPLEKTENENGTRVEPSTKAKVSLESSPLTERESDELEVGSRKGRSVHEKVSNLTPNSASRKEKRGILTDSDQSRRRRLDYSYGMPSESQELRNPFGPIRSRPIGFHRNSSILEKGRFGNLPYSTEVPSSSHSTSLHNLSRVQEIENDRVELLKKLDDLRTQLSRSWPHQPPQMPHQPPPMPHQPPHHHYLPPTYQSPFLGYNQHDPILHRPSCSCSQCCNINWQPRSFTSRETSYGPCQLPRHRTSTFDLGNDSLGTRYPRRRVILTHGGERVSRPVSGGAPFISCCNCLELLKIPKNVNLVENNNRTTIKCAVCSALISLRLEDNKIVASASTSTSTPSLITQKKVNERKSNRSPHDSLDYDNYGYNFQLTDTEPNLSTSEEQSPDSVIDKPSSPVPISESQNDELTKSQRTVKEKVTVDHCNKKSLKDALVATEIDVPLTEYLNCGGVSKEEDQLKTKKVGSESFFACLLKKRLISRSSGGVEKGRSDVYVNGQLLTERAVKKAEKLAGPIHPGEYWYDSLAGFWGVMNQPCLGIIPPFIQEFDHPMPKTCAAGDTGVFVNGRELHKKDLDLLAGRGLPTTKDRSYIIDISGKVVDEDTGEELDALGRLAPTVERVKHGFGMKVPKVVAK